jgi:ribosomal protein S12 methylthiotransferase accessory factor
MPGEHFTHPITTGCAAHRSFELAAANAILEVIERDALASTWLLKRSVRRINLDEVCQPVKYFCKVQKHFGTEVYFFDISTDLNIPVVLGLQRRPSVPFACSLLSCSAAFSYEEACEKVVRDAAICRYANRVPIPYSSRPELFRDVRSGAAYMADVTRASAFDFLTETNDHISLHELDSGMTCFRPRSFSEFDSALSAKLREVILVDLTTPESSDLGIHVVRAILPDLQPISFHQRARFLGHSRLIDLARREGRKPQGELEINSAPLPFA